MSNTIIGYFDFRSSAQAAVRELQECGYDERDINMICRDEETDGRPYSGFEPEALAYSEVEPEALDKVEGIGAGTGTLVGGITGLLTGMAAFAIPGIGPVVALGPIVAGLSGAVAGAVAGAVGAPLLDSLMGVGVPEQDAEHYAEGIRGGGALVAVDTDTDDEVEVDSILNKNGATDIHDEDGDRSATSPVTAARAAGTRIYSTVSRRTAGLTVEDPEVLSDERQTERVRTIRGKVLRSDVDVHNLEGIAVRPGPTKYDPRLNK